MSAAMLHGLGDCTKERNCGCLEPKRLRLKYIDVELLHDVQEVLNRLVVLLERVEEFQAELRRTTEAVTKWKRRVAELEDDRVAGGEDPERIC